MKIKEKESKHFNIGDFYLSIYNVECAFGIDELLPSFKTFSVKEEKGKLFQLTIKDSLQPIAASDKNKIRSIDTGNGDTIVDRIKSGGYQFIIKDIDNRPCCLLQTNEDFSICICALNGNKSMRSFGLNNALMLIFAFAGCKHGALLLHASSIQYKENGYAFVAKSGTGKSTHSSMWLQHIKQCDLVNDDTPILRLENNKFYIYGSPWSGKTPCYRKIKVPLEGLIKIERSKCNSISRLSPAIAFATILPCCSSMVWDDIIFDAICNILKHIVEIVPIYKLKCLPNEESALVCMNVITK